MSDPFAKAKGGRLTFKGGVVATRSKAIDKNLKKKQKKKQQKNNIQTKSGCEADAPALADGADAPALADGADAPALADGADGEAYTIDAAKRMKYEELFPVETKKFGYDPHNSNTQFKSVEDALDDRVKKKADRYCK